MAPTREVVPVQALALVVVASVALAQDWPM